MCITLSLLAVEKAQGMYFIVSYAATLQAHIINIIVHVRICTKPQNLPSDLWYHCNMVAMHVLAQFMTHDSRYFK